jgi:DNA-binding transcriptional ArsR family regulator
MGAAAAIKAIADPHRQKILRLVSGGEVAAGDIASHFRITRPAVSQHLRVLKNAGLLEERREGTKRYYRARPEGLAELRAYLEQFWNDSLEQLKVMAEREHDGRVGHDSKSD